MSSLSSDNERPRSPLLADRRGEAAVSFALVLPLLIAISFVIAEMTLFLFNYHRASEAIRGAVREAVMQRPIASLDALSGATPVDCSRPAAAVVCTNGAVITPASFDQIVGAARAVYPAITADRIRVEYRDSGIGSSSGGGRLPVVRVRLVEMPHDTLLVSAIPGMPRRIEYSVSSAAHVGRRAAAPGA
jgi:hypothetical protein